jgi:AcrR family transcriptional regulator
MMTKAKIGSAHEVRSAKTRTQLIEAAIKVIGAVGYEGASTRALARAAKANLSAIPYHFGGKRELYLAAAQVIAEFARRRFDEVLDILDGSSSLDEVLRFEAALIHLLHAVLDDAEPHAWKPFLARCVYENDDAFALIYEQAIGPMLERLIRAAAVISRGELADEAVRLRVSAIVTVIVSFKFLRGIIFHAMGRGIVYKSYVSEIEGVVRILSRLETSEGQLT